MNFFSYIVGDPKDHSNDLDRQRAAIADDIARFSGQHVQEFSDTDITSEPMSRPGFNDLIMAAGIHRRSGLVVASLSVMGPTEDSFVAGFARLEHHGIQVVSSDDSCETFNAVPIQHAWTKRQQIEGMKLALKSKAQAHDHANAPLIDGSKS